MKFNGVSIIISSNGRNAQLNKVLSSLLKQRIDNCIIEIIVVLSSFNPETTKFENKNNNLQKNIIIRYLHHLNSTQSEAKNLGIVKSSYELLIFMDDDTIPQNNLWLNTILKSFEQENIIACCGKTLLANKIPFNCGKYISLFTTLDEGNEAKYLNLFHTPPHAHFAILKSELLSIGGYRKELGRRRTLLLSGEDDDLSLCLAKKGIRIYYNPKAVLLHDFNVNRLSIFFMIRRIYWQGITDTIIGYLSNHDRVFTQLKFHSILLNIVRVLSHSNSRQNLNIHLFDLSYIIGKLVGYLFIPYYFFISKPRPINIYDNL